MHVGQQDRRQEPSTNPSTVGSLTIIVPGLGRVIVAFPDTSDSGLVTVGDMLFAVSRVVQESSIEHHGELP